MKSIKVGNKIHIIHMSGEPHYDGREGVVRHIDDMGTLFGTWGGLGIVPDEDSFTIIEEEEK